MAIRHRTTSDTSVQVPDAAVVIPAVGYLRCSDDSQIAASIPAQKSEVEKYATEHGYNVLRWYIDGGISGWKEDREQFQRLIADVEQRRDFRAVVCWHSNRFSRFPVLEANHYWYLLERAGVSLVTVAQGKLDFGDIGSWLKASIEQHGDAQHRFKLSADIKRGMQAVAEKGLWQHAIPYGYRLGDDRRLVIGDPAEIAVVRRIFAEYIAGHSIRSICIRLNQEGIPSARGSVWVSSMIHRILKNPSYVGTYRHADIEFPNHHPAIIDLGTFTRANRSLAERQRVTTPIRDGGGFLFSKLIRCGKCEGRMDGLRDHRTGHHRYVCATSAHSGMCPGNNVRQDELLATVVDAIVGWASDPEVVETFRAEVREQIGQQTPSVDPATVRAQLVTCESKLVKAKKRLVEVDTDLLPVVQDHLREVMAERERLQRALEAAQTPRERILAEADELIEESFRVFVGLREAITEADPERVREMIRRTVQRIDVVANQRQRCKRFALSHGNIILRSENLSCLEYQP